MLSNAISLQAANSSAIQEILKDAELRRIIRQIDGADKPEDVNSPSYKIVDTSPYEL